MSTGSKTERKSCAQLQQEFADLIQQQMKHRGISVRKLVEDGVILCSHRSRFFERIAEGSISIAEFNKVREYLEIDRVRAALVVECMEGSHAYFEPTCQTTAGVAIALAVTLAEEMAACEGTFEPIRDSLCQGIAKKTSTAIARYHAEIEARRNDSELFNRAFG